MAVRVLPGPLKNMIYRRTVLEGYSNADRIMIELGPLFRPLSVANQPIAEHVLALNDFFLWHLAHCPKEADRQEILKLAENFAGFVSKQKERVVVDLSVQALLGRGGDKNIPVPGLPVSSGVEQAEPSWFRGVFPQGEVPAYSDWLMTKESLAQADKAFDLMRLALTIRGRFVGNKETGENYLSLQELPELTLWGDGPEQVVAFHFRESKQLLALFVKNGWPVGYGAARPAELTGFSFAPKCASINLHVFSEYRMTPSSTILFTQYLDAVKETFAPQTLIHFFDLKPGRSGLVALGEEDRIDYITFLRKRGFKREPKTNRYEPLIYLEVKKGDRT